MWRNISSLNPVSQGLYVIPVHRTMCFVLIDTGSKIGKCWSIFIVLQTKYIKYLTVVVSLLTNYSSASDLWLCFDLCFSQVPVSHPFLWLLSTSWDKSKYESKSLLCPVTSPQLSSPSNIDVFDCVWFWCFSLFCFGVFCLVLFVWFSPYINRKWIRKWQLLLWVCLHVLSVGGLPHHPVLSPVQPSVIGTEMSLFLKADSLGAVGALGIWWFTNFEPVWIRPLKIKPGTAQHSAESRAQQKHNAGYVVLGLQEFAMLRFVGVAYSWGMTFPGRLCP